MGPQEAWKSPRALTASDRQWNDLQFPLTRGDSRNHHDCSWTDDNHPEPFITHTHTHTQTHTLPTCRLARGCLDSGAAGPESYYLRGGLSSWQPLEFMKSQYLLFFSVSRRAATTSISAAAEYIKTFWVKETTNNFMLLNYAVN